MRIEKNKDLSGLTTFRMGGMAQEFYIPESRDELIDLISTLPSDDRKRIIAGGSNLLINDKITYKHVIYAGCFDDRIIDKGNGHFYVGASVRVRQMINYIHSKGYGGIEYLASVPGMLAGIIYMNAGKGRKCGQSISNFVHAVYVLRGDQMIKLTGAECCFSYRSSVFKQNDDIILGAELCFTEMDPEAGQAEIKTRLEHVRKVQDHTGGVIGTVFSEADARIMRVIQMLGLGWKKGVRFSKKTSNWLLNMGDGTFAQALFLIHFVLFLHKMLRKQCELETEIWNDKPTTSIKRMPSAPNARWHRLQPL